MIDNIFTNGADMARIIALIFAFFHFLAGFVIYREIMRVSGVIVTKLTPFIKFVATVYLAILILIIVILIFS